jgi:hypothetical protein
VHPSSVERLQSRLNELGVGTHPTGGIPFIDHSPDAIRVREVGNGHVELEDRKRNSWVGQPDVALEALALLERTDNPVHVWNALATAG